MKVIKKSYSPQRFAQVLDYLKKKHTTQAMVAELLNVEESTISKLKSGAKYIGADHLAKLNKEYNINPDYICGTSNAMLDILNSSFYHFEKIVTDWDTVMHSGNNYLHLHIKNNLYRLLTDYNSVRLYAQLEDSIPLDECREKLVNKYQSDMTTREFVLVPIEHFTEIVQSHSDPSPKALIYAPPTDRSTPTQNKRKKLFLKTKKEKTTPLI